VSDLIWIVGWTATAVYAFSLYHDRRDAERLAEHYRDKWRDAVNGESDDE